MLPPDASTLSIAQHQPEKCRHIGICFMLITSMLYSANSVLAKVITVGAVEIGFFRTCLMYICVTPILLKSGIGGVKDILGPRRIRMFLILRGLSGSISGLCFYLAVKHTSPGMATSISFLDVVLTPFMGRIFLKESLTPLDLVFASVSFTGVILIARPPFLFPSSENSSENLIGIIYAVVGALIASFSYIFLRKIGTSVSPLVPTFYFAFVGSMLYFVLLLITGDFEFPCLHQVGLLCLLSMCGLFGVVFLTLALHTERPSTVAVINTLQIVFVFVAQVLILDDIPSTLSIIGSSMIFSMSMCIGLRKIINETRNKGS